MKGLEIRAGKPMRSIGAICCLGLLCSRCLQWRSIEHFSPDKGN